MRRVRCFGLVAAMMAAGCQPPGEKLAPVSGVITAAGKAVPSGTVTFYPDGAKGNKSAHQPNGVLDADGRFEMYVPPDRKGAPPGAYRIVVYAVDDPQPGKPNKYFAHRKYADLTTTPLRVEVVEKPEPGRYDLKLDP
ncbi:MAG: hypothetical protein ACRC33_06060 [Gemmataceae bacterium]